MDTVTTLDKGHGRRERRTLKATTAWNEYLDWPGVAQVGQVDSEVLRDGKTTQETAAVPHQCFAGGGAPAGRGGTGRSRIVLITYVTSPWVRTPAGFAGAAAGGCSALCSDDLCGPWG